ncbi:chromosome segregation protein SMC [Marispirochaeta aestuarii]|uniref:Chromosome partition protein Smc n=1 Tax=Marispirochaeta aestuarii TaxID=1963862 RepID=A0A1Y1RVI0_9SPIO|nr:AAA family ATPase [Marispirochaeta aestuarii]ORC31861.1 chromosome segregation protein SMC [Marispirochaeta aestuarii]
MFLKNIEIFGFKSFADRVKIDFAPGISALLGPNGCGKSNVVDAIKWVLGEQASRSLRAERMEDVIFNGTEQRKALNVAEVTLTLSNDEGVLPMDMPEIAIKRRLYRSGESEYFVNNTPVKLRELRELFFDTGVGKSAYSIMEQGKIDQILSHKPEERRYIFEEAAGITKFKVKGAEAERKLSRTEENMRQVEGILGEVKRSYDSLKKQADKTEQYRRFREDIFELELKIQLLRLKGFLDDELSKEKQLKEKSGLRDSIKSEIDTINESLEENLDQVNTMESSLIENQKMLYGIDVEKGNLQNQQSIIQERRGELHRHLEYCKNREAQLQEQKAEFEASLKDKREVLEDLKGRHASIDRNILEFDERINSSQNTIRRNESEITRLEGQIAANEASVNDLQDQLRAITDDIVGQLDRKLEESAYSHGERMRIESAVRDRIDRIRIHVKGKLDLVGDLGSLSEIGERERTELVSSIRGGLNEALAGIDALQDEFKRYTETIPAFLDDFLAPEGTMTRKRNIDEQIESTRNSIAADKEQIGRLQQENRSLFSKIEEYRGTLQDLKISKAKVSAQITAAEDALALTEKEIRTTLASMEENQGDMEETGIKLASTEKRINELKERHSAILDEEKKLRKSLDELEKGISLRNRDALQKEKSLKDKMSQLAQTQSQVEKIQVDLSAVKTEIRNLFENFREKHSRELTEFEDRMYEIREDAKLLREKLGSAREQLRGLGHVNLMAPEEFAEVKERYDFLENQLQDLRKAREDLNAITKQIRTESRELFLSTYEKIKKNFHVTFRRLFGGGRGELKLTEPDQVLTSGIEIFAQPPGKRLENITLLSGGERSLTAVALLFATYMVRPSPFCILDEIDAALDENNVGRFVTMLMEFANSSQFIVITHNKKTVAGAQTLLGITMEESGISKIIAIRVDKGGSLDPVPEEVIEELDLDLEEEE